MNKFTKFGLLFSAGLTLTIGACTIPPVKEEIAKRIAAPAWMVGRELPAKPFSLTVYERMHERLAPADIYIEGDGVAWVTKTKQSANPTPENPVALHLASRDKSENVAYIARPCQFSGMLDPEESCDAAYWGDKRFAPEVIESYQIALDEIKARYDITKFNLIGFSGGAAVAAILAAERDDVASLRTVAGNLDHRALSAHHNVSYMDESLNPPDYADKLRNVPQYHFIGGQDQTVPPGVLHSYLQAIGSSSCVGYEFVQESAHEEGWVNKWPDLLKNYPPVCKGEPMELEPLDLPPEPYYYPRMGVSKK